jgi:23S rRNA (cytosine1962-C5)-methyltransferase
VVKIYSAAIAAHLRPIVSSLCARTEADGVVVRLGRSVPAADLAGLVDGDVLAGSVQPGPVEFVEHGLRFGADVRHGQKTGFFLDQRVNRATVGQFSSQRDVLDVFAATGGFSVHAAAGGARSVHSVDLSAPTLAVATVNMASNTALRAVRSCTHTAEVGDAFAVLQRLGDQRQRFDLTVIDPPSFASRQTQVDGALRAYERLARLAARTVRNGGMLMQASCSSRVDRDQFFAAVHRGASAASVELHMVEQTTHDIDHPVTFPEAAYLKAGFWTVTR